MSKATETHTTPAFLDALSIMEIGRAAKAAEDAQAEWSDRADALSGSARTNAMQVSSRYDDRREELHTHILTSKATTLAEALVQVSAALTLSSFGQVFVYTQDEYVDLFGQMERALSSIAGVLIREAGIDAAEVCGDFAMSAVQRQFHATVREAAQ